VHSSRWAETLHPVAGPVAEARTLYVEQLRLVSRLASLERPLVVWDVGLGAGANALVACRESEGVIGSLRLLSFDCTVEPMLYAAEQAQQLEYPRGYEERIRELIRTGSVSFLDRGRQVHWTIHIGDFPTRLREQRQLRSIASESAGLWPAPDAILFDPYSPRRNPVLWSLEVFEAMHACASPDRPCQLATYSRSTLVRCGLLLAGFYVGCGLPVAGKEETTVASTRLESLQAPLDRHWLLRAFRSGNAEPIREGIYPGTALCEPTRERLTAHPQFATG